MRCEEGLASLNSDYELRGVEELGLGGGIPVRRFGEWYADLHEKNEGMIGLHGRKDP